VAYSTRYGYDETLRLGVQKEADRPSEHGCCPIVQGVEAGGNFPVGLSSFRVLALWFLSQAWHLGGLHRASPVPFRGSSFTPGLHPPGTTPQGLNACLYRHWGFPPISSMRFVAHSASFPTGGKEIGSVPFSMKAEGGLWNNERGSLGKEVCISN
jgi:hypothetical protein